MLTIREREAADRDRGSGTIYVLAMTAAVVLLTSAGLALGQAVVARHRAAAAADLSAISAASRVLNGPISACKAAALVARSQGARLTTCRIDGEVAEVTVEVLSGLLSGHYPATGVARAGPADPHFDPLKDPARSLIRSPYRISYGRGGGVKPPKPASMPGGGPRPLL